MGRYSSLFRMMKGFETQFEADGKGGYVYRLRGKGRPIPVSDGERRRFIDQYFSRIVPIYGAMLAATMMFFLIFYGRVLHSSMVLPSKVIFSDPFFYEGMILIALPIIVLMYWLAEAPARALKGRAAIGPEPTRDEKRAIGFRKMSYGRMALIALVGGGSYRFILDGYWDRRWFFMPPLIVSVVAVQAFRKWRFERLHPDLS